MISKGGHYSREHFWLEEFAQFLSCIQVSLVLIYGSSSRESSACFCWAVLVISLEDRNLHERSGPVSINLELSFPLQQHSFVMRGSLHLFSWDFFVSANFRNATFPWQVCLLFCAIAWKYFIRQKKNMREKNIQRADHSGHSFYKGWDGTLIEIRMR